MDVEGRGRYRGRNHGLHAAGHALPAYGVGAGRVEWGGYPGYATPSLALRFPIDCLRDRADRLIEAEAVDDGAGGVGVAIAVEVLQSELDRVPAHLPRNHVHLRFIRPADLHDAETTEGP